MSNAANTPDLISSIQKPRISPTVLSIFIFNCFSYCMVHLKDGTHKLVRSGIGNIAKQIEGSGLYKINKSYIINFEYLDKINEKTVEVDGVSLPLSVLNKNNTIKHCVSMSTNTASSFA